jgi:CxxC motif-containing protein
MIATTVAIVGGSLPRLPVISVKEAPKALLGRCLEVLYGMKVRAPVRCGDIIVKNICDTGVDIAASRSINRKDG